MATVDLTEYQQLARDGAGGSIPSGLEPNSLNQQLTPGATAVVSAPLREHTRFIRIHTDTAIRVRVSAGEEADQTDFRIGPGGTEFFGISVGGLTVSVIATN